MLKDICKILAFALIAITLFLVTDQMFYNHESNWESTDDWSDVDYVFMGTSHIYCSINPAIINDALHIKTVNLCSSSQPVEITYFNLKNLLDLSSPKAIFLDPYILASSVDSLYESSKSGHIYENVDGLRNPWKRAEAVIHLVRVQDWLEGFAQICRPLDTWDRFSHWNEGYKPYNILGFKLWNGVTDQIFDLKEIEQYYLNADVVSPYDGEINPWLTRILDLATENKIPVYIIQPPTASMSAKNIRRMKIMHHLSQQYSIIEDIKDYNHYISEIGLVITDYYDLTHLNRIGGTKFTQYFIGDLEKITGKQADWANVGWSGEERYETLGNECRYTVDLYDGALIRFVVYNEKGKVILRTDSSKENSVTLPIDQQYRVKYEIKGAQGTYTYDHPQMFTFLKGPQSEPTE